ncbi:MAG: dicarboxylate/amino acid:cation symporter [Chlamydiia bacterium]|nr:dicarboxylate/amino acid:cation symporter [Chlamydiia bacterium]
MKLWVKILIAMLLGALTGAALREIGYVELAENFKPLGDIFLRLINMIIVLLILSSMTVGITSIHDPSKLGRVGLKTLFLYVSTTLAAIAIGMVVATVLRPGAYLQLETTQHTVAYASHSLMEMIFSMIPKNPIKAMVEENVLQIIVFSVFLGVSINFAGEKGRPLLRFLDSLAEVMYRLTSIVMEFSPIGVYGIMTWVIAVYGPAALGDLAFFLGVYVVACAIHVLLVNVGILHFLAKLNPLVFFRGMGDALITAFSTSSSSATLPVTMHCVQENLGVSKNISGFVLPLGSTVNMNGAAIYQAMCALFVAQRYGITLEPMQYGMIVFTATVSAIGAAGIPGSGFLMLSVVLGAAGLPTEGLAYLYGIDRIREMFSTMLNVLGDAVCAVYVAKQEGELNERRYYRN